MKPPVGGISCGNMCAHISCCDSYVRVVGCAHARIAQLHEPELFGAVEDEVLRPLAEVRAREGAPLLTPAGLHAWEQEIIRNNKEFAYKALHIKESMQIALII